VYRLSALAVLALSVSVSSAQASSPGGKPLQTTAPSHSVSLTVFVQDVSGAPIPHASVRVQHWSFLDGTHEPKLIEDADGSTNSQGEFHLKLPQGLYDVFVSAPSFVAKSTQYEIHKGVEAREVFRLGIYTGTGHEVEPD
jgi:hypothetical protein